jgi:hypothetical protein
LALFDAPWNQRTYPFSPSRIVRGAKYFTESPGADALEIVEPVTGREEPAGSIRGEPAIGKLIFPLDVKGSLPEIILAYDLYFDLLCHLVLPVRWSKTYISRD